MKKLKIILQHNIIYYVFLFIVIILYLVNSNTNHISIYSEFKNEIMIITNIEEKDYGLKFSLKGKEKVIGNYYLTDKEFIKESKKYNRGDIIKVSGDIKQIGNNTVPNTFNYKKYLISNEIYNVIEITSITKISETKNIFYKIKNTLIKRTKKLTKSYSYINSLILGNNNYLDESTINSYRENGISHLFAISGLHISIFILILSFFLDRLNFNEKIKYLVLSFFLIFYMFLTNFSMSVIRGVIFTILMFINKVLKLEIKTSNLLILTLIIIMFYNPLYINNIGLLYSFLVTFSLITYSHLIKGNKLKKSFMISLISFLVAYPITINNFYSINFLSIIYNIFFVPYVSLILLPLTILGYIFPILDNILYFFITIIEKLSLLLNNINFAKISMAKMNIFLIIIYYLIIYTLFKKINDNKYKMFIVLILFFIFHYFIPIRNNNYVMFFDVGQGDSILINLNHNYTLIDTGGKISYDNKEYSYYIVKNKTIPYLKSEGIKKIENLVLTHGDADHMKEAEYLVQNLKVEKVIFNCGSYNDLESELIKILDKKKVKYSSCINELNMDKYKLKFLNTKKYDNENDNSSVIYLNYNGIKMLFMGDAGVKKEQDILETYNIKKIDFLKVGHHGSNTSSSKEFINSVNPKYSVISVGKNNRYGHPKESVLDTLSNSKIYRTDIDGSIEIKLNKNGYKISTCPP